MPELPDVVVYVEHTGALLAGRTLQAIRLLNPFVLRSVEPPPGAFAGRRVAGTRRIGKRVVIEFAAANAGAGDDDRLYAVIHLMIAGRLRWLSPERKPPGRISLAVFEFEHGRLVLTEAGSKRRASLHLVRGAEALARFDAGGVEPLDVDLATFAARLTAENHTLKRALTDPRLFAGIGNAYSDEILWDAQLSPVSMTAKLDAADVERLHRSTRYVLAAWIDRLRAEAGAALPERVTAFHPAMAVHGRYGQPCPRCGAAVQRIVYADNETNYCARCQTQGKLLADRSLSRLLHASWPKSIDELG
jgi:formamidopyrimidine-DNA glycosylase